MSITIDGWHVAHDLLALVPLANMRMLGNTFSGSMLYYACGTHTHSRFPVRCIGSAPLPNAYHVPGVAAHYLTQYIDKPVEAWRINFKTLSIQPMTNVSKKAVGYCASHFYYDQQAKDIIRTSTPALVSDMYESPRQAARILSETVQDFLSSQ